MASLLVYVDAERLGTLVARDQRDSGRAWQIDRSQLPEPQLDRLDEDATLFVFTIENDRAIIVATIDDPELDDGVFTGGSALLRDYDITDLAPRLGSTGAIVDLATWAAIPRILPPSDVDLLRYTIGLASDLARPPAPPEPLLLDDPVADELRQAVFADPAADEPRVIYADYLQSRGDPRGELIALQIARYRSGSAKTDRERTLVARYGADCTDRLSGALHYFELSRGFLHLARTGYFGPLPGAIIASPAWSTVDMLSTAETRLVASPHVRARRLGIRGVEMAMVARTERVFPFETIVGLETRDGWEPSYRSHKGAWIDRWDEILASHAFGKLRVLGLDQRPFGPHVLQFFRSPLAKQLEHLDIWTQDQPPLAGLRDEFERSSIERLTFRFLLGAIRYSAYQTHAMVAFERSSREPILRLQVSAVLQTDQVQDVMRYLAPITRGIARIELNDLESPDNVELRHAALIERLGTMFSRVVARPGESMAP